MSSLNPLEVPVLEFQLYIARLENLLKNKVASHKSQTATGKEKVGM